MRFKFIERTEQKQSLNVHIYWPNNKTPLAYSIQGSRCESIDWFLISLKAFGISIDQQQFSNAGCNLILIDCGWAIKINFEMKNLLHYVILDYTLIFIHKKRANKQIDGMSENRLKILQKSRHKSPHKNVFLFHK